MKTIRFRAVIEQHKKLDAAYIQFPFDVYELFGTKGRVKVKAIFDGKIEYRGSLANMGMGCHRLGITKEIRKKIDKSFGDEVEVEIVKDIEDRVVPIPNDVMNLFKMNKNAYDFYKSLSFTDQKEYMQWIESAKKEVTRAKRIVLLLEKLANKKRYVDK